MHEKSLDMKHAIYTNNAGHPEIVYSFHDLSNVHPQLGSLQKANHYVEKSNGMSRVIREHKSATAQRDLAANSDEVTEMRISCEDD